MLSPHSKSRSEYRTHSFIAKIFEGEEQVASFARMNCAPPRFNPMLELPAGFMEFLGSLHRVFTPRQQALVAKRTEVLREAHSGRLPNYQPSSEVMPSGWQVALPVWCCDQRNQMTGPDD